MAGSHPNVSIDDLLPRIKAFLDMLILSSGYQSSGLPAKWNPDSITNALRWGVFFEDFCKQLIESDEYSDSIYELDRALSDLKSSAHFPQGLAKISFETLSNARKLVLEHFLQSQPLMSSNLVSLFTAVIEMDMDEISKIDEYSKRNYLEKLTFEMESLNIMPREKNMTSSIKEKEIFVGHVFFLIEEIFKRKVLVSYISSSQKVIHSVRNIFFDERLLFEDQSRKCEGVKEYIEWKEWRSKSLSYLLSEKTIKIVSGANLIFTAPKEQWIRVFESLSSSSRENFRQVMEICLLGLVAKRWNHLVEGFISQTCDFVPISTQYSKLHDLLQSNSHENIDKDPAEEDILEYLMRTLSNQHYKLWIMPPILVAAAIPSWSILYKIYMAELEKQLNGTCSKTSGSNYNQDKTAFDPKCDFEERIRGLYAFHIKESP